MGRLQTRATSALAQRKQMRERAREIPQRPNSALRAALLLAVIASALLSAWLLLG